MIYSARRRGGMMGLTDSEFIEIFETYEPKIEAYLAQLIGPEEAEDLAQEVFIKVSSAIGGFRGESKLSTWLYRIATNVALDRLRNRSFQVATKMTTSIDSEDNNASTLDQQAVVPAGATPVESQVIKKEMGACVREHIELMPEKYKIPLILSEYHDLKNREIAEILQLSLDVVKIRLHRARVMLKDILEDSCNFYKDEEDNLACDRKQNIKAEKNSD